MRNHPDTYVWVDPTPTPGAGFSLASLNAGCVKDCICHNIGIYAQMRCTECDHNG